MTSENRPYQRQRELRIGIESPFKGLQDGGRTTMPSHFLHVVQAFEEREGAIVPLQPEVCPSAGSARALAARLAQNHVGVIAWSRSGDPDLGEWGPPEVLARTGVIPDEYEAGGGIE